MKPSLQLIRAISAEFLRRKLNGTVMLFCAVLAVLLVLGIWLTTISAWWWLLVALLVIGGLIGLGILLLARIIIRLVKPAQTDKQAQAVRAFVDKLERVQETVQTPMPLIVFQVARDVVRPRTPTYLQKITRDGTTLHTDFLDLQKKFNA